MESLDRATCHDVIRMLDDYVDRELDPKEIERIRRHLEICAACADEVHFEERVSHSSPSPSPPPDPDPDPDPRCARVPRARVAPRRARRLDGGWGSRRWPRTAIPRCSPSRCSTPTARR